MSEPTILLNRTATAALIQRLAQEIAGSEADHSDWVMIGIQRGGVLLAERLADLLQRNWNLTLPVGQLDVGMHRDDLDRRAAPTIHPTVIPFDITGRTVVLVDDVLYSGRTTRAALDALNDFGRPKRIQLAVLIDRGHRELPIEADFVGQSITTAREDIVHVELEPPESGLGVYLQSA